MKLNITFRLVISILTICTISCSGEDGTNGTNGLDGTNGEGFEELTKFGYMTMVLEGTRPDNVAFKDSTLFKFTASSGSALSSQSRIFTISQSEEFVQYVISIKRYLTVPNNDMESAFLNFNIIITNPGEDNQVVNDADFNIVDYAIIGEDKKFFVLSDSYDNNVQAIDFELFDVNYTIDNGSFTFSYSFSVDAADNDSGNLLKISGLANVVLVDSID